MAEQKPKQRRIEDYALIGDMRTTALVDAFGAYSSPTVSAFLRDVPMGRASGSGAAGPA